MILKAKMEWRVIKFQVQIITCNDPSQFSDGMGTEQEMGKGIKMEREYLRF